LATASYPWRREHHLILAILLLLAAAAWALLIWQSIGMDQGMEAEAMGAAAPAFLGSWMAMMVAMMFPSAAPMILMFARIGKGQRQRGQPFVPTAVFVAPYLAVWTLFGAVAYAVAVPVTMAFQGWPGLGQNAARSTGIVLVLTGLYQLTPWKDVCLSKCRSPLGFLLAGWRDGYGGAVRMGVNHALYCVGCCWLLFVALFPLGVMNLGAMALVTAFIFVEKALPAGRLIGRIAAVALIVGGVVAALTA
jgi:predicted metal-binding membrane protein